MKCQIRFFLSLFCLAFMTFAGHAQVWSYVDTFELSSLNAGSPSMVLDTGGRPYIVYSDQANGNRATLYRYTGAAWTTVGPAGFTPHNAWATALALNSSNTPYVFYEDSISGKGVVMKYTGTAWVNVGDTGFTSSYIGSTNIAIDQSGTPYVAYLDATSGTVVKKFNGSSWVAVGAPLDPLGVSVSMVLDTGGTPYVVYVDDSESLAATVKKFNGISWVKVGTAGFTSTGIKYPRITIDGNGTLYVVYTDNWASISKLCVMKYEGASWMQVGIPDFSTPGARYPATAVDDSGNVYVLYSDSINSYGATVMKFYGGSWVGVGIPNFTQKANILSTSLVISHSGTPFMACSVKPPFFSPYVAVVMSFGPVDSITGPAILCVGTITALSDLSDPGGSWTSGNTSIATIDPYGNVTTIAPGIDTISYVNTGATRTFVITVIDTLPAPGTISGPSVICRGSDTTLSETIPGGLWSSSSGVAVVGSSSGLLTGFSAGNCIITYSVKNSCGTSTATMALTVDLNSAGIIGGIPLICVAANTLLTDATAGGAWSSGSSAVASVSSAGVVSGVAPGSATISYSITNICGMLNATRVVTVDTCSTGIKSTTPITTSLTIFPSPNNGSFTLNLSSPTQEAAAIIITNLLGQKVKELTTISNTDTQIQLNAPPGVYFISAITKNETLTGKMVVE